MTEQEREAPSSGHALLATIVSFSVIVISAVFLRVKTQSLFLIPWIITIPSCMKLGYTCKELQQGIFYYYAESLVPMAIVPCVGALTGIQNAYGTVSLITKPGLLMINPRYFLVISFVICIIFSLFTGTSLGTCGMVSVTLMGVGLPMELHPFVTASSIISGAYFGDAISPLSGSTSTAADPTGVGLLEGIKYQTTTTLPAAVICAVIFFLWGLNIDASSVGLSSIGGVISGIKANYRLRLAPLIPIGVVLVMLLFKVPSIPSALCGSISGFLVAWLYQGQSFTNVTMNMWNGYILESSNAFIAKIFSRKGITSMSGTASPFIFVFGLFGILSTAGITDKVVELLMKKVNSRLGGIICTVILGFISNITSTSGSFSFVFTGDLMTSVYEQKHLNKQSLIRTMSAGCLLSGLLVPWDSNPLTVTGSLGVDSIQVLPYPFTPLVIVAVLTVVEVTGIDKKFSKRAGGSKDQVNEKEREYESVL